MNNMLTLEEVKIFLEIDQPQLEKYLKERKIKAYKVGGAYIRFRKEDVVNLRSELRPNAHSIAQPSFFSKLGEFWRFNNFYIISVFIVVGLILYFLRT